MLPKYDLLPVRNTVRNTHSIYTAHRAMNPSIPACRTPSKDPFFDNSSSRANMLSLPASIDLVNASCPSTHSRISLFPANSSAPTAERIVSPPEQPPCLPSMTQEQPSPLAQQRKPCLLNGALILPRNSTPSLTASVASMSTLQVSYSCCKRARRPFARHTMQPFCHSRIAFAVASSAA